MIVLYFPNSILSFMIRYLTDVLNMMQPVYVFIIFVLKRNVIETIQGKDKKKRKPKPGPTSKTKTNVIKNRHYQGKDSESIDDSNQVSNIAYNKDTELTEVASEDNNVLLSAQSRASNCEEIPLTVSS